jgi:hypothetical protein
MRIQSYGFVIFITLQLHQLRLPVEFNENGTFMEQERDLFSSGTFLTEHMLANLQRFACHILQSESSLHSISICKRKIRGMPPGRNVLGAMVR